MAKKYDHVGIEEKWLAFWEEARLFYDTAGSGGAARQRGSDTTRQRYNEAAIQRGSDSVGQRLSGAARQRLSDSEAEKIYLLFAFAYPSGSGLHVGHAESKTALDILARYHRMNGKDVFFPVGWDAFGLPAENYAIKTGVPPAETTVNAIKTFRRQIKRIGISYDWSAELATSNPGYYKWTQWIFTQLYNKGLAYKKPGLVNWCPSCQTVLANEQVVDGHCERCATQVIQKQLDQWYFGITKYQDELISGLDQVDWPKATEDQQKHWIGKSEGLKEKWKVKDSDIVLETFTTWPHTTWGATFIVLAAEHPAIDDLVVGTKLEKQVKEAAQEMVDEKGRDKYGAERDKQGVFTGRYAINPLTGWEMPIYVANFALMNVGTGVVKGAPAHDERDFEFAKKYDLPVVKVVDFDGEFHAVVIKESVSGKFADEVEDMGWYWNEYQDWGYGLVIPAGNESEFNKLVQKHLKDGPWYVHADGSQKVVIFKDRIFRMDDEAENAAAKKHAASLNIPEEQVDWDDPKNYMFCYHGDGVMVNAGFLNGMTSEEARKAIVEHAVKDGYGEEMTTYRLRDWLISRQRYWGAPIPIVYDPEGNPHPVKDEHLPWTLPTDVEFKPTGESPLTNSEELKSRVEKLYGKGWTPEFDTMDTFVDSSWYFLRYMDTAGQKANIPDSSKAKKADLETLGWDRDWSLDSKLPFSKEMISKWLPVDFYMIGPEHIVLHLLYARFFTKFLRDEGHLDFDEPFLKMRHQGMILGPDHKKMSKSKGNVIDPDVIIKEYGADTLRMYEMFMGPIEADKPWSTTSVAGIYRFLTRVHRLVSARQRYNEAATQRGSDSTRQRLNEAAIQRGSGEKTHPDLERKLHQTIRKVTEDIPSLKFNTSISSMMELVNLWEKLSKDEVYPMSWNDLGSFAKILAPFAPFLSEQMWEVLGKEESIHLSSWPEFDAEIAAEDEVSIPVQVNGKLRSQIIVSAEKAEDKPYILEVAKADEKIVKWLEGKEVRKEIFVPGRLVNLVIG